MDLPDTWEDLTDSRYYGRIAMPDPKITGAGRMIITSMVEKMGRDDALVYLRKLDGNVKTYAESTGKAAELAASGDCAVAVTFLHDGIAAMRKMNDQLDLVVPSDETGFDLETSAILKGCGTRMVRPAILKICGVLTALPAATFWGLISTGSSMNRSSGKRC